MTDAGVTEVNERVYLEGFRYARAEGFAEGRIEGRATLVCRLAGTKFGPEAAEQLSQLLEGIADPERIARVGERVIECDTGADLRSSLVQRVPDRNPEMEQAMLFWEVLKEWVLAGAASWGLEDDVLEEMLEATYRLDERIIRACERNGWKTGAELLSEPGA